MIERKRLKRVAYLDFNTIESLAVVYTNDGTNHLRNDDHVTKVSLDSCRLLKRASLLLSLSQALDESHRLSLETSRETAASTCVDELHKLLVLEVKKLVKIYTPEGELLEGALLAHCCDLLLRFLHG